jgi:hypothetical protein
MRLGFTGTREDATEAQVKALASFVRGSSDDEYIEEAHHGCCKGSDKAFHNIMKMWFGDIPGKIQLHPPDNDRYEMQYTDWEYDNCIWSPKKPYLVRDDDIVDESTHLAAFAKAGTNIATIHSGTWYTVRKAIDHGLPVIIWYPDGKGVRY